MFCKKGVVKNSTKHTGNQLCQSLFRKVAGLRRKTLLKIDSDTGFFFVMVEIR